MRTPTPGPRTSPTRWLVVGLVVLSLAVPRARASSEYEIKAAFLYNFAKFVEWPAEAFASESTPFRIGLLGDGPLPEVLPGLVSREQVRNRPIEIRRLHSKQDLAGCHLLFVSRSETKRLNEFLPAAAKAGLLVVGEDPEFLTQGGMITFVLVDKTVRFDINKAALAQAGLKVSSKLLAIARHVQDQP